MDPVKIYRLIPGKKGEYPFLLKFRVYLKDRPGSLAAFSSAISVSGGNIGTFLYDRSQDDCRVVVEVNMPSKEASLRLVEGLKLKYSFTPFAARKDEPEFVHPENVLELRVRLIDRPGTLAGLARLLKRHRANVTYMLYDGDLESGAAEVALATEDPSEIDRLLEALNRDGYHYRVVYRGSEEEKVERIIGLKAVEKFFIRLSRLLGKKDVLEIKKLVENSRQLHADLAGFYSEAGCDLESADVFEKVLALASMSRGRTGERFKAHNMPPLEFGGATVRGFRMPTSENIYVFETGEGIALIDAGYGTYYEDVKGLLISNGLDPAKVKNIYVTHPDADHAGSSGLFAKEFGARVHMHPGCLGVIESCNRAHGITGKLANLNRYYTSLINTFTECTFPEEITWFKTRPRRKVRGFKVTDSFKIGGLDFDVLESRGGHVPGHVFFVEREHGLIFPSDYMINIASLSSEEKDSLGIYKYLLVNTNADYELFKEELRALKSLIAAMDEEMKKRGKRVIIFPGHGDYFTSN